MANRIKNIFKNRGNKVIPYFTAGYPTKDDTVDMVLAAEKSGAAMVELGIPFSDPLADGPIIQDSSRIAIENGVNLHWILKMVSFIREKSEMPISLMGYVNPIIKYGMKKFINKCSDVGVDGLIIPDLPPEEAGSYVKLSHDCNISPILLVAPNSSSKRINEISSLAKDLIYCTAILGITGSPGANKDELESYLSKVEQNSICPFIVGFGIKDNIDVRSVNKHAHGAVVGSAIISRLNNCNEPINIVSNYVSELIK